MCRVPRIRMQAQLINGAFSGLAGAVLAINLGIFQQNLTNGLGFIAVALRATSAPGGRSA